MPTTRLKWLIAGLLAGVLLAGAVFLGFRKMTLPGDAARRTLDPPGVVKEIQQLSTLVSVRYLLQKAIGLEEKKIPFGSEKILLFVHAEVLAGVDLDELTERSVSSRAGGHLAISLPPPKVLHVVIDDKQTKVWDRRITWWTPWVPYNPDLERRARLQAREEIEQAALEMGILREAGRNAETGIRSLLTGLGAASVTFVPRMP